jgi:hypothetical protein
MIEYKNTPPPSHPVPMQVFVRAEGPQADAQWEEEERERALGVASVGVGLMKKKCSNVFRVWWGGRFFMMPEKKGEPEPMVSSCTLQSSFLLILYRTDTLTN